MFIIRKKHTGVAMRMSQPLARSTCKQRAKQKVVGDLFLPPQKLLTMLCFTIAWQTIEAVVRKMTSEHFAKTKESCFEDGMQLQGTAEKEGSFLRDVTKGAEPFNHNSEVRARK